MNIKKLFITFLTLGISVSGIAQNPIVQTYFTADPAPMVYNGTVYVYTPHDEDTTVNNFFTMYDWRCYSSDDMVNWTEHGAVASLKDFEWMDKSNGAWAPQAIERNGKFYLYVPIHGEGYTEGPWIYKRNDLYYLIYAAGGIPEYIAYSTAPTAEGPISLY